MHRRTVSIVGAIIVVGGLFAFAGDLDPPAGPIGPTMHTLEEIYSAVAEPQCCSPRPEDIRSYYVECFQDCGTKGVVVVDPVQAPNGFMITDIVSYHTGDLTLRDGAADGPVILRHQGTFWPVHFNSGHPVSTGTTIIATGSSVKAIISGYIY